MAERSCVNLVSYFTLREAWCKKTRLSFERLAHGSF